MKLAHLKKRQVINVYNGQFIGYIKDIVISFPNGNIETIIVQPNIFKRIAAFFSINNKIYVEWPQIISIGKDVILVNIIC